MGGMRPIVEIMTVNFSLLALDQILNNAATIRHMSGGQFGVPLVIRMATGAGRQLAAQHSHSLEGWYAHIPGIKVLAPATLEDARGMLWTALDDPDPVLIFEHAMLYNMEGELAATPAPVDIDHAAVRRAGSDVTLITYGGSLCKTLEAAEALAGEGIEAEVIDLRVLRPLDDATILASVRKTHRAVLVDEGWRSGSLAAEISARIMEQAFCELDAPVGRVCSAEVPIPYAKHLEEAALPQRRASSPPPATCWERLMAEFRMPSLGADMEAGTLVEWLSQAGRRGDSAATSIAVVETQKGAIEIEIFEDGTLERAAGPARHEGAGRHAARDHPRGRRGGAAQPAGRAAGTGPTPPDQPPVRCRRRPSACRRRRGRARPRLAGGAQAGRASAASTLAAHRQRDRGGAASTDGCAAAAVGRGPRRAAGDQSRAAGSTSPRCASAIAAAMARSKREIPHYYLDHDVDLQRGARPGSTETERRPRAGAAPAAGRAARSRRWRWRSRRCRS